MSVSAVEKSKGISKNIVITNDKDRLTEDQINEMVKDAEVNKASDDAAKKLISERNSLEHLVYTTKAQLDNDQLKDKFTDTDRKSITDVCESTLRFLESCPNAELQELQEKTKAMNAVIHPIMQRIYQQTGGMPQGQRGQGMDQEMGQ